MKRFLSILVLVLLVTGLMTAAAPMPNTTFTLVGGDNFPSTMNVGDQYTVVVDVTSDQPFLGVQAMPSFAYPGKGVVAVQGGDRAGSGTSARVQVTFQAKSSTAKMTGGVAPVYVVVGVRYPGGVVVPKEYVFYVKVP